MTRARADRIGRIACVQRQMQRAAEWTLHDLRRQEDVVRVSRHEVLAALSRDDNLLLGLAPAILRRLRTLASEADELTTAGDRQTEVVREQTGRVRQVERLERAISGEIERERERSDLDDLVDAIAGGARATLR